MTEQDEEQRKAMASFALSKAEAMLKDRLEIAKEYGKELRGLADLLRDNPGNIELDCYQGLMKFEQLKGIVSDIRVSENEFIEASDTSANAKKRCARNQTAKPTARN